MSNSILTIEKKTTTAFGSQVVLSKSHENLLTGALAVTDSNQVACAPAIHQRHAVHFVGLSDPALMIKSIKV